MKIDLNNIITWGNIEKYKSNILNTIIVLVAVFISYNIYKGNANSLDTLRSNIETELKNNEVLKEVVGLEKKFNAYKSLVNKKEISSILTTLNALAGDSGVRILSIRPLPGQKLPEYQSYSYSLSLQAGAYRDIGRFISGVESHSDIYNVDSMGISSGTGVGQGLSIGRAEETKNKVINVQLKLSTVLVE